MHVRCLSRCISLRFSFPHSHTPLASPFSLSNIQRLIRKRKFCKRFSELNWKKKNNNILHISLRLISISILTLYFFLRFSALLLFDFEWFVHCVARLLIYNSSFFVWFDSVLFRFELNWVHLNGFDMRMGTYLLCECVWVHVWLYETPFVESKCILMFLTHSPKPAFERRLCTRCWLCSVALCGVVWCCVLYVVLCVSVSLFFSHSLQFFVHATCVCICNMCNAKRFAASLIRSAVPVIGRQLCVITFDTHSLSPLLSLSLSLTLDFGLRGRWGH